MRFGFGLCKVNWKEALSLNFSLAFRKSSPTMSSWSAFMLVVSEIACVCKHGGKIKERIEHSLMLAGLESMCEICWVHPSVVPYAAAPDDWTAVELFVPFDWCVYAGAWLSIVNLCSCNSVIYHLLSGHRPFSFYPLLSTPPALTPTSLRLTGWSYTRRMWWWARAKVFTWTCCIW